MSYSAVGGCVGRRTAIAAAPHGCAAVAMPNTPDVINSIIAMTDPFDRYAVGGCGGGGGGSPASEDSSRSTCSPVSARQTTQRGACTSRLVKKELEQAIRLKQRNAMAAKSAADNSPTGAVAATASAGSAASSPGGGQAKKRRTDGESTHGDDDEDDEDDDGDVSSSHGEGLTAEDEERRKRRRERNKIAATRCRRKKQEKTKNLMQESDLLVEKNFDLKSQIQKMEKLRISLMRMISTHSCTSGQQQQRHPHQQQQQQQQQHSNPHQQHPQHHHHHNHHQQQQQLQHHQQHQPHPHQQQQNHHHQYSEEPAYANDEYHQLQNHHVAAEPPILKDTMFNVGGYVQTSADQPTVAAYQPRPAASMSTSVHYPIGSGGVYASCVDDLYGGPPDLSHQFYDHGIC